MSEHAAFSTMRRAAVMTFWAGFGVFLTLIFLVRSGHTDKFDEWFILKLRNPLDSSDAWGPVWFQETAAELTALGGYPILVLASIMVVIALLIARKNGAALFVVVTLVSGSALSSGLKLFFNRPRPDLVDHLDRTFTSSFPSAHAMVAMIAWLTLAAIAIRFIQLRRLRVYVIWSAVLIALIIGATRVYLGVHWPSDVVAGWAIGLTWASGSWLIADSLSHRSFTIGERNSEMGRSD